MSQDLSNLPAQLDTMTNLSDKSGTKSSAWWHDQDHKPTQKQRSFNKKNLLILVAIILFIFFLVVVSYQEVATPVNNDVNTISPTPIQPASPTNSFEQELQQLQQALQKADPAIKDSPFPVVEMNLQIN